MSKALILASVASMIDQFNMDNISILQELGYEVHVICNFENGNTSSAERVHSFVGELEKRNIMMKQVPIPRSVFRFKEIIQSYRNVRDYMKEQEFDIVHCHSPIGGAIGRLAGRSIIKRGGHVMYTAHGFHFYKGSPLINWCIFYPIEKLCGHFTDILITINREDYLLAKKHIAARRIEYIPGVGVDCEAIKNTIVDLERKKKELTIPPKANVILSIGELSVRKNTETILHIFAKLEEKDTVLLLCGKGKIENRLRTLAKKLQIDDRVIFAGYRTDIYEILKISDIFIFPSKQEGLPVALMQAMAAGLPAVVSNIRGNVDLIPDRNVCCLFECMDSNAFAKKIDELLKDEDEAKRIGLENQINIRRYDKSVVDRKMKEIYQSFILTSMR